MTIIQKSCSFLNTIQPNIQKKVQPLFQFGFLSLSMQRVVSLNANARTTVENIKTAESKIYRLCKNERILSLFPELVSQLGLVKKNDLINVDFSDFNGRQVLLFAKQTEEGRAIPLYFDFLIYPIEDNTSQNVFIIETIKTFLNLVGVPVRFVFDRGFACPSIIDFLANIPAIFYIRIKKDKIVELKAGLRRKAKQLSEKDNKVIAYGHKKLRLIISGKPNNDNEPWYIITNDNRRLRETIINIYYHRFEIEELFKDAKHVFLLEHIKVKKDSSFKILLWFVILGLWFIWFIHQYNWNYGRQRLKTNSQYHLSIITHWLEWLQYEIRSQVLKRIGFCPY